MCSHISFRRFGFPFKAFCRNDFWHKQKVGRSNPNKHRGLRVLFRLGRIFWSHRSARSRHKILFGSPGAEVNDLATFRAKMAPRVLLPLLHFNFTMTYRANMCHVNKPIGSDTLELFNIGDDDMQARGAIRLGANDFSGLEVTCSVSGSDSHLVLASPGGPPRIAPGHPRIR